MMAWSQGYIAKTINTVATIKYTTIMHNKNVLIFASNAVISCNARFSSSVAIRKEFAAKMKHKIKTTFVSNIFNPFSVLAKYSLQV
ncbi:hypothetical protein [Candidatus Enterovibrio escicola]|uniref:hypothetical protein n=1 Tax=Candidatus Enterovibrio escicola TaxID=1927127 RepID=UPI00167FECEE|nr:hypothetical protein [Candidatus Enterovibrio escacola]